MLRSIVLLRLLQDKLSYITDVAMREQRLPRKAGSGTLWDRCGRSRRRCGAGRGADVAAAVLHYRTGGLSWHRCCGRDELTVRFLLEEGKLNLCLR